LPYQTFLDIINILIVKVLYRKRRIVALSFLNQS
jgi:hypothetical protein